MGRYYLRQGNVAEALLPCRKRLENVQPVPLLSTLGSAYLQKGKLDDAKRVLQSALLQDPASSGIRLRLATVLEDLGKKRKRSGSCNA
jgi:predicted Zn-dependent protease